MLAMRILPYLHYIQAAEADIIITTALIPNRPAPKLVRSAARPNPHSEKGSSKVLTERPCATTLHARRLRPWSGEAEAFESLPLHHVLRRQIE